MKNHLIISLLILSVGCKTQKPIKDLTDWYENGQKKSEIIYRGIDIENDEMVWGKWTEWYENGQRESHGEFYEWINDNELGLRKQGLWIYWYKSGERYQEINYMDGFEWDKWTEWYKNGNKKGEGYYYLHRKGGLWTKWYGLGTR